MHESSKNVQACLADMYEPDWYGKNEVDSIVEVRSTLMYFFEIQQLSALCEREDELVSCQTPLYLVVY